MAIPEHIKKYLSPAELQEIEAAEGQRGGGAAPALTFEQWLAQNPQYGQPEGGEAPGKNKNPTKEVVKQLAKQYAKDYVKKQAKEAARGGMSGPATLSGSGTAFSSGNIYQGQPVGTAVDGGTMMSTGETIPASEGSAVGPAGPAEGTTFTQGAGQVAQGALGAYQAYNGYNQYQEGDKVGGGLNMAAGGANVASAAGSSTASSAGPYLSAALGAYNTYNALRGEGTAAQRSNEGSKAIATAVADFYTFGGASLAKKAFSKEVGKIDSVVDPIMGRKDVQQWTNPLLYHAARLMGESTRGTAKRHSAQLMEQSEDPGYQAYVSAMRQQHQGAPPDPSNPFGDTKGNKYATWADYEKGGLDAANLTGVMGNIETFGPDWTKLNFEQQQAITQALIDASQYESKKGEVLIRDQNKAREIYDGVSKGAGFNIPAANPIYSPKGVAKMPGVPTQTAPPISSNVPVVPYPAPAATNAGFKIPVANPPYSPKGVAKMPEQPPQAPLLPTQAPPGVALTPVKRLLIPRASGSMAGGLTR